MTEMEVDSVSEMEVDETPFNERLAIALCPSPCCRDTLVFSGSATAIECKHCGLLFTSDNFDDAVIEPVVWPEQLKYLILRRRAMKKEMITGGYPRMVNRLIDGIHGPCHEKLLEPIFMHYGWDPADETLLLIETGGKDPLKTFRHSVFAIPEEHMDAVGYGLDRAAAAYLRELLAAISHASVSTAPLIAPLTVLDSEPGDRLVEAISRALVGRQILAASLRASLTKELKWNADRYKHVLCKAAIENDWMELVRNVEKCSSTEMRNVRILALANVLKRPIILLDNVTSTAGKSVFDHAGTFLPKVHRATDEVVKWDECCGSRPITPLLIAWDSDQRDHLVPLIPVQAPAAKYGILLPRDSIPPVWGLAADAKPDEVANQYLQFKDGYCILSRGSNWFTAKDLAPMISTYNTAHLQNACVNLGLLSDYIVDGRQDLPFARLSQICRDACDQGRLVQCIECGKVTDIGKTYDPMDESDRLCNQCCTLCNRLVHADGFVTFFDGDHTLTTAPKSKCRGKRKHYWAGKEYDNQPLTINVEIQACENTMSDNVRWFAGETNVALNSVVETEAEALLKKHNCSVSDWPRLTSKLVEQIIGKVGALLDAGNRTIPDLPMDFDSVQVELDDYPAKVRHVIKWADLRVDECPKDMAKLMTVSDEDSDQEKAFSMLCKALENEEIEQRWRIVCSMPKLFKRGGILFTYAQTHGLFGSEFVLPMFPDKMLMRNFDSIEWYIPQVRRSFPIGPVTRSFVRALVKDLRE